MRLRVLLCAFAVSACAASVLTVSTAQAAAAYPGTKCVSDKIKSASGNCKAVLGAWSKFVGGGEVTSGTLSPSLEQGIGMAYVPLEKSEPGTPIEIDVRGRTRTAEVRAKPLYSKEN